MVKKVKPTTVAQTKSAIKDDVSVAPVEPKAVALPKTRKVVFFAPGRAITDDDALPEQAKVIVAAVHAAKKELTRDELAEAVKDTLKTKQPVDRIIGYYQSKINEMGVVKVEKREIAA